MENSTDAIEYIPSNILIPPSLLERDVGVIQTGYSTPILFQLIPDENDNGTIVDTEVIGVSVVDMEITNASEFVLIQLQSMTLREGIMVRNLI